MGALHGVCLVVTRLLSDKPSKDPYADGNRASLLSFDCDQLHGVHYLAPEKDEVVVRGNSQVKKVTGTSACGMTVLATVRRATPAIGCGPWSVSDVLSRRPDIARRALTGPVHAIHDFGTRQSGNRAKLAEVHAAWIPSHSARNPPLPTPRQRNPHPCGSLAAAGAHHPVGAPHSVRYWRSRGAAIVSLPVCARLRAPQAQPASRPCGPRSRSRDHPVDGIVQSLCRRPPFDADKMIWRKVFFCRSAAMVAPRNSEHILAGRDLTREQTAAKSDLRIDRSDPLQIRWRGHWEATH